jgi:hypothetical protein
VSDGEIYWLKVQSGSSIKADVAVPEPSSILLVGFGFAALLAAAPPKKSKTSRE